MSDRYKLPDGRTRMKAHDVRQLRACSACGELGDDRMMIHCMIWGVLEHFHDECAVQKLGEYGVLKLPLDELNKISIGAAGADLMRKIMDRASTLSSTDDRPCLPMHADIEQIITSGWRDGKTAAEVAAEILREIK